MLMLMFDENAYEWFIRLSACLTPRVLQDVLLPVSSSWSLEASKAQIDIKACWTD